MLKSFGACLLMLALGLAFLLLADSFPGLLGLSSHYWKTLALAQLISAVVIAVRGFRQYRCPVCTEVVRGHDKYYLGVILDPEKCPNCGAQLRD